MQKIWEMQVQSLGWEDPLEEGMVTHSSILAWKITWTEEPSGLQSIRLQRMEHNWSDLAHKHTLALLLISQFIHPSVHQLIHLLFPWILKYVSDYCALPNAAAWIALISIQYVFDFSLIGKFTYKEIHTS